MRQWRLDQSHHRKRYRQNLPLLQHYTRAFHHYLHTCSCCKHCQRQYQDHNWSRRRLYRIQYTDLVFYFSFNFVLVFHYGHVHIYTNKYHNMITSLFSDFYSLLFFFFFFLVCVCVRVCVYLCVFACLFSLFLSISSSHRQENAIFSYIQLSEIVVALLLLPV
jgi:hypothetical protein